MLVSWTFAASHLLLLGIGLGAIWSYSRALQGPPDPERLRRAGSAPG
jgi:hypothetical protein